MAKNYLFVCTGNRERSPYAAHWFADYAAAHQIPAESRSAGLAPDRTELQDGRARLLDDSLIAWADVVCAAEDSILREVQQKYPDMTARTVNLDIPEGFKPDRAIEEAKNPTYAAVTPANVRSIRDKIKWGYGPRVMNALLESKIKDILGE